MKRISLFVFLFLLGCHGLSCHGSLDLCVQGDQSKVQGWTGETEGYQQDKLKVITYNIWNGYDWGKDNERRAKLQNWMANQKPDVVALQELCAYTDEILNDDAKTWGHDHSLLLKTSGYSVGLTSRHPIVVKEKILEGMHHGALHCMSNGIDYVVVHLHPGSVKVRREEAHILSDRIELILCKNPNVIVLGDFNAHSPIDADLYKEDGALLTRLRKSNKGKEQSGNLINQELDFSVVSKFISLPLYDVTHPRSASLAERGSFPGRILGDVNKETEEELIARLERIDYIFASESLAPKCTNSKVYNGEENWFLSDHYPVVAEFQNISFDLSKNIATHVHVVDLNKNGDSYIADTPDEAMVHESSDTFWKGFKRRNFIFEGKEARLIFPDKPLKGNPWIWRARFPDWHTTADSILVSTGFHLAYIDTNNKFGSPKAMNIWDGFYKHLTEKYALLEKVALIGVSRGGLFVYNWAKRNPDKVSCIYAEAPVCDFKSWPFGFGKFKGNSKVWGDLKNEYGFKTDIEATDYSNNPIDNLETLAKANVPVLHMISLEDEIVPPEENTFILVNKYIRLGGTATVISSNKGLRLSGHHFEIDTPERVANFIKYNYNLTGM